MKSFTNRLVVFAASAVALGTMAYGQTMKAEIPFAFHTAKASLPAGNYMIERVSGAGVSANVLRLYNTDSHRSVVAVSAPLDSYRGAAEKPSVVFACGAQGCILREIKTSTGIYSYPASGKSARDRETVSLIEVPLITRNGD
jgi:hypothetical protein